MSADGPRDSRFTAGEPWTCCPSGRHLRDSVFNVALRVRDVEATVCRAARAGSHVLQPPVRVDDADGSAEYAVIRSMCGNLVHTVINTDQYSGTFLPGFLSSGESAAEDRSGRVTRGDASDAGAAADAARSADVAGQDSEFFDHVTLTCRRGESTALLDWYQNVFGMRRFQLNR